MTDQFLAQLADLCRTDRTRPKWVFVPSHAVGHTLGERLVLEGTDWANLRFCLLRRAVADRSGDRRSGS